MSDRQTTLLSNCSYISLRCLSYKGQELRQRWRISNVAIDRLETEGRLEVWLKCPGDFLQNIFIHLEDSLRLTSALSIALYEAISPAIFRKIGDYLISEHEIKERRDIDIPVPLQTQSKDRNFIVLLSQSGDEYTSPLGKPVEHRRKVPLIPTAPYQEQRPLIGVDSCLGKDDLRASPLLSDDPIPARFKACLVIQQNGDPDNEYLINMLRHRFSIEAHALSEANTNVLDENLHKIEFIVSPIQKAQFAYDICRKLAVPLFLYLPKKIEEPPSQAIRNTSSYSSMADGALILNASCWQENLINNDDGYYFKLYEADGMDLCRWIGERYASYRKKVMPSFTVLARLYGDHSDLIPFLRSITGQLYQHDLEVILYSQGRAPQRLTSVDRLLNSNLPFHKPWCSFKACSIPADNDAKAWRKLASHIRSDIVFFADTFYPLKSNLLLSHRHNFAATNCDISVGFCNRISNSSSLAFKNAFIGDMPITEALMRLSNHIPCISKNLAIRRELLIDFGLLPAFVSLNRTARYNALKELLSKKIGVSFTTTTIKHQNTEFFRRLIHTARNLSRRTKQALSFTSN